MTTGTIIKIILAAPFAALVLWAIRLRLRLKKMGVKVSEGKSWDETMPGWREEEPLSGRSIGGWSNNDEFYMPGGLSHDD